MKLKKIKIENYKSISSLDFDVEKYDSSYMTVLLGKNETGKSNILEAMSWLMYQHGSKSSVKFNSIRNLDKDSEDGVSCFFTMKCSPDEELMYREEIKKANPNIGEDLISNIKFSNITKEVYLDKDNKDEEGNAIFSVEWDFDFNQELETFLRDKNNVESSEPQQLQGQSQPKKLTLEELKEAIQKSLEKFFYKNQPIVSFWAAKKDDLISKRITLTGDFYENPDKYPFLRNMFYLCEYDTSEEIKNVITKAKGDSNSLQNLEDKLKKKTTEYVNEKWEKHEIDIFVKIHQISADPNTLEIEVLVQDKDNEKVRHNMYQRSQGFKQIMSFLFILSIPNHIEKIKDQLILIDEPEVHMHASGVNDIRKELLKIGENNYLFVATHSFFMIDRECKKRHLVLTKEKGKETITKQIEDYQNIYDDEVLRQAFGINVIRDLLSPKKLLVEGASDTVLIGKALSQINDRSGISIANGVGDNLKAVASFMAFEKVYPLVVTDADEAGKKMKKAIIKVGGDFSEEKVKTIRDLNSEIKERGTIEDTLPKDYVWGRIKEVLREEEIEFGGGEDCNLNDERPFMEQVREFLNKTFEKQKIKSILDKIKMKISEKYETKKIEAKAPLLHKLAEEIVKHFDDKKVDSKEAKETSTTETSEKSTVKISAKPHEKSPEKSTAQTSAKPPEKSSEKSPEDSTTGNLPAKIIEDPLARKTPPPENPPT